MVLLGREIPRAKGSSSKRENLDNFFTADGQSGLVCLDAIRGVVHIGRMSIAVGPPVQRLSFDRQVPAFFIFLDAEFGICQHNICLI